jgi:hypothetical protein
VGAPSNAPPSITLTGPEEGTSFTAPAAISLTATVSDPENSIARVEFYSGTTLLGSDTTAPYAFTWSSVAAGSYTVHAVAYDADGASATSQVTNITVIAPNGALTVTLTSPVNGSTLTAPAIVILSAAASDPENSVSRVEFYAGSTLLATDTTAPYTFTWSSVTAGTYALRAVVYDNAGASGTSATSTITVSTPVISPPRGVAFHASADHDTLVTRYELRIFASGANPATATPIAISDLGKSAPDASGDITVDRSTFFIGLAVGDYLAVVAAVGEGGSSMSSGVAFTR